MSEVINTYLLSDPDTIIPMDREEFYKEQIDAYEKTGVPSRAADVIAVYIFNRSGELLVQKRSYDKKHNPGLLDKSIGGHVKYEDGYGYTVMVETVQELQTPSIVLKNKKDFEKTFKILESYLTTIAIIKHNDSKIYVLDRIIQDKIIKIANKVHIYFGFYDGRVRPVDKEAQGVLWYTLDELDREIKKFPQTFTQDMHTFFVEYRNEMQEFIIYLKKS